MGKKRIFLWCSDVYEQEGVFFCGSDTKGRAETALNAAYQLDGPTIFLAGGIPTKLPHYPSHKELTAAYMREVLEGSGYFLLLDAGMYEEFSSKSKHRIGIRQVGDSGVYGSFEEALAFAGYMGEKEEVLIVTSSFHMFRVKLACWFIYGFVPDSVSFAAKRKGGWRELASIIETLIFGSLYRLGAYKLLSKVSKIKNKLITH